MSDLVRYDAACHAIAEARSVDEVKDIHDTAIAMKAYARMAKNKTMEADAVEIRMKATRRLDKMIKAQSETIGLSAGTRGSPVKGARVDTKPTLASQGIDKNLAHQARVLGALSDEKFETVVVDARSAVNRAVRTVLRSADIEHGRQPYDQRIQAGCTIEDLIALAKTGRRHGVIYIDPPWTFRTYSGKGKQRSCERYYDVMSIEQIKALPIGALAAPDCGLFLWGVCPEVPGALDIIKAWNFEFKTKGFTWIKTNPGGEGLHTGMGYYTRSNSEDVWLATRGRPKRLSMDVHQVVMAPVGEHSEKPEEVRRRIERLFPGPYLELFARKPVDGWTTWGNEIRRDQMFAPPAAEGAP